MSIWKFRLAQNIVHSGLASKALTKRLKATVHFRDEQGNLWLTISTAGEIMVIRDYAWDGCSPKFKLFGWLLLGTPDGAPNLETGYPFTYFASCIHDALCQFECHPDMPYSRAQIDTIFYERLVADGFPAARLYYWAVRLFGGLYSWFTRG